MSVPGASAEDAARRRAAVRAVLGRPGSWRRWLLTTALIIAAAALLFALAGFLGRIAIFILAAALVVAAFRARSLVIGDEDELRAALRRRARPHPGSEGPVIRVEEKEWAAAIETLRAREGGSIGAPPPPIVDEGGAGNELADGSSHPALGTERVGDAP